MRNLNRYPFSLVSETTAEIEVLRGIKSPEEWRQDCRRAQRMTAKDASVALLELTLRLRGFDRYAERFYRTRELFLELENRFRHLSGFNEGYDEAARELGRHWMGWGTGWRSLLDEINHARALELCFQHQVLIEVTDSKPSYALVEIGHRTAMLRGTTVPEAYVRALIFAAYVSGHPLIELAAARQRLERLPPD